MLVKVSELTGAALDLAVANCWYNDRRVELTEGKSGVRVLRDPSYDGSNSSHWFIFFGSTYWEQGGPIIDREKISLRHDYWENGGCRAFIDRGGSAKNIIAPMYGPTSLIAAMRCYVASKLGDEVEIPDQLK